MSLRQPPSAGFTLIELLVVISILAVLMGLILPTVGFFQRRAKVTRTTNLLAKIDAAIVSYQQDWSHWPYSHGWVSGGTDPAWAKISDNSRMLYRELVSQENTHRGRPRPGYLAGGLRAADVVDEQLVDDWGRPVIYIGPDSTGTWRGPEPMPGFANMFELWSAGPDSGILTLRGGPGSVDADNIAARAYEGNE